LHKRNRLICTFLKVLGLKSFMKTTMGHGYSNLGTLASASFCAENIKI